MRPMPIPPTHAETLAGAAAWLSVTWASLVAYDTSWDAHMTGTAAWLSVTWASLVA